jgi:ubiquinone/menaquinone biosynthesis C-methylase UbiE
MNGTERKVIRSQHMSEVIGEEMMSVEQNVAAYYTRGTLEEKILGILRSTGKNPDQLRPEDIAAVDNFHVGGLESTEALAGFMGLRPGMHLLDVGCGIGGPARYFAAQGYRVTGIDLTEEFTRVAESLTRMTGLDGNAHFRQGSALEMPFDSAVFDGAYMIHVGMNIENKAGLFREAARVLKPGARFAIFDIMGNGNTALEFPVPWAATPATSFVASVDDYRRALEQAGFRIDHQRSRRQFALEFMQKMAARASAGRGPVLGVHLLMGEQAPAMLKNVNTAIASGALDPAELVAVL